MLRKKSPEMVLDRASAEERDSRTVLAMQLSQATKEKDLKEFFSTVGDVKAVKLIQSLSKKRQKNIGIAYIEFKEGFHCHKILIRRFIRENQKVHAKCTTCYWAQWSTTSRSSDSGPTKFGREKSPRAND